ncbi:MAG: hypothetical protein KY432_02285 [Acidobacteria bacterium]|nr:hypothetical protein [Acidobacteriota bacterium]
MKLIDRDVSGGTWVGTALLAGGAAISVQLAFMSLVGVDWSRGLVLGGIIVLAVALWFTAWKSRCLVLERSRSVVGVALAVDLLTVLAVAGHGVFATLAPVVENDFMTIWGLKARTFWIAQGIDVPFLTNPWSVLFHVDYPILLPLAYDAVAILGGEWNDRLLGAVTTFFAAAALIVIRRESLVEAGSDMISALTALGISGLLLSPWIGLAEGPLAAYVIAGVLVLRRGLKESNNGTIRLGAILIGCGALVKNEGLALMVAVFLGVLVADRSVRRMIQLWPALLIASFWLIPRIALQLSTDLGSEGVMSRVFYRIVHPGELIKVITGTGVGRDLVWIAVLLGIVMIGRRLLQEELFTVSVIAAQFVAYLLAYMASPHDLEWHVTWSWERLVSHISPLIVFIVAVQLARVVVGRPKPQGSELPSG